MLVASPASWPVRHYNKSDVIAKFKSGGIMIMYCVSHWFIFPDTHAIRACNNHRVKTCALDRCCNMSANAMYLANWTLPTI
jgi:hypothetical protein